MVAAIETARLTKTYRGRRGIAELDLRVEPGEVFGFLGPNGAGKTTTIRVLMDFLHPTSGQARVLGFDSETDSLEIHRRVGYVPGDTAFYPHLTAGQQLRWVAGMRGDVPERAIGELAERFDLDLSQQIRSLSRGNRQKVALVLAFMHRPDLLLLDEPTSGLDPLVQERFHELVAETVADGRTVFLSSHILEEVDHLCDRVGVIRSGRLVAVEKVRDLRGRAGRDIAIRFDGAPDIDAVRRVPGVRDVVLSGDTLTLHASGDLDELVKLVATQHVTDFVSTPPELEQVFLGYYRSAAGDDGD